MVCFVCRSSEGERGGGAAIGSHCHIGFQRGRMSPEARYRQSGVKMRRGRGLPSMGPSADVLNPLSFPQTAPDRHSKQARTSGGLGAGLRDGSSQAPLDPVRGDAQGIICL